MTASSKNTASSNVWNGVYSTWKDACKAAGSYGGVAFSSENWLERITQQLSDYRDEYRRFGIALPPRPCNLPLVCAMTSPASIIDFGGSSGWCWDYLQNSLPRHTISSYVVVELESVASHMKASGLHSGVVNYQTLGTPLDSCDLLYSNSVLQYFESNVPLVSMVKHTNPSFVFLEDVVAKGDQDFFSTQFYYGVAIPYRFIGLGNLLKDLLAIGYEELARFPYMSPIRGAINPLPMENFPEQFRLQYSQSVLMHRLPN